MIIIILLGMLSKLIGLCVFLSEDFGTNENSVVSVTLLAPGSTGKKYGRFPVC